MPRQSLGLHISSTLAAHPVLANQLLALLGPRLLEHMAHKSALKAAKLAYERVPFYRSLFEQHGFDARQIRHLTWPTFRQLPASGKREALYLPDHQLRDTTVDSPAADVLLGKSSGTTREPTTWPTGWDEFYLTRAYMENFLRSIQGHRVPTAVVLMMSVDGGDLSGNLPYRLFFSIKEKRQWPFELFATGEEPETVISTLRWIVRQEYRSLFLLSFPGTVERLLDKIAELEQRDPEAGVRWTQFEHKRILLSGQIVSHQLRERIRREMRLNPRSLIAEEVALGSSDTGQMVAHSTPFTSWLERYLDVYPDLYDAIGIPEDHRAKPLMEFVPPNALLIEQDEVGGLLLTTWKHRPLIRYRSNDLAWLRSAREIVRLLDRNAPGWRRDFKRYGYGRAHVPSVAMLGMVLGRADDIRIVNSANVSPEMLRAALDAANILPRLHHFKHDTDDTHPNEYRVYLELREPADELACVALAEEWRPPLLNALVHLPVASDLLAAHRANPIVFKVFVRSPGEEEFEGDADHSKLSYVPRRTPRRTLVEARPRPSEVHQETSV